MTDGVLSLSLMGTIAIRRDGRRQTLHLAGQTHRLFTLLAANVNQARRRESVLEEIWPDAEHARACSALNTAVWRIKKMLDGYDGISLVSIDQTLRLSVEPPATVDVETLDRAVAEAAAAAGQSPRLADCTKAALSAAVAESRGVFLEGCCEHWVLALRERYSALYIRALGLLMRDEAAREDYEAALVHGREILTLDPYREGTQRDVMGLYALNGQRVQAVQQFDRLRTLLKSELGIEPMAETVQLLRRITAPGNGTDPRIHPGGPQPGGTLGRTGPEPAAN